jgi:hypothetical protein
MNRRLWTIGTSFGLMASLALAAGTASFAAQSGPSTATSSSSPAQARAHSSPMTPVEANRQLQQLERVKHRFELSAGNDRGSHSALAARHIQTAINEIKLEMQEEAYGKNSTQAGQVQSTRGSTSAANSRRARARKN